MTLSGAEVTALTGAAPDRITPLHGGDLSDVYRVDLSDGRVLVAKSGPLVATEARMLTAMGEAGALVPRVIAARGTLLIMEYLKEGRPSPETWECLGRQLAGLHAARHAEYGWSEDYAFGPVTIHNPIGQDWPAFWAENRLLDGLEALPLCLCRRLEHLATRLGDLLPARPPGSLLHGDLWSGNVLFMAGDAALIDPACYHGHAEVDLAMLTLFGAPHPRFWEGYGTPDPGFRPRCDLYQLWPALVHLRLFGEGYMPMVERCLDSVGA